jgi:hypothetical protein
MEPLKAAALLGTFESCSASSRLRMKEPPKAAALFHTLTPPRGESVQKRITPQERVRPPAS